MSLTVSVALCTYNGAAFIARQVESILDQDLPPAEIIVSDDGSTDRTLEIVRAVFASRIDTPVALRILDPAGHLGVSANFQRAIEAAHSDLVALSDQDDVWHPDRLSRAVPRFEEDPSLLLQHSDARLVDETGAPLGASLLDALYVSVDDRSAINGRGAFARYLRRNIATGATMVIRRSLLEIAAPFPAGWVHDEWLALIASAKGRVQLLDDTLIDYRQHGSNVIGVTAPTLIYRIRRMLQPRGSRYVAFARRATDLVDRLGSVGADPALLSLAAEKARFEAVRAGLSRHRIARVRPVLVEQRRGSYRRLSSQGDLDVFRDIFQPA
jgi:glycosyltransferase involved in cell wall biosynthesis